MKVKIGPYRNWYLSPYRIAEFLYFWASEEKQVKFGDWLAYNKLPGGVMRHDSDMTRLNKFLNWISVKMGGPRTKVRIDPYDTWSMDHTLAYIILPMLLQLKETKAGSARVADKDVPPKLRSTAAETIEADGSFDSNWHARWNYVLDEMIYAFTAWHNDTKPEWDDKFWNDRESGKEHYDRKGHEKEWKRIENGFRLFGTYYAGLWD